jgi:hypothetical protein
MTITFGYFLHAVDFNLQGQASAHVQIRPLTEPTVDQGFKITLTLPLNTTRPGETLESAAAHALASAQQLLPAPALADWAARHQGQALEQAALPPGALAQWQRLMQMDQ